MNNTRMNRRGGACQKDGIVFAEGCVSLFEHAGGNSRRKPVTSRPQRKTAVVAAMHEQLRNLQDAAVETVLTKFYLGPTKMTHMLGIHGNRLFEQDAAIQGFATLEPICRRLGYRRARDTAFAAATVASRLMATPNINQLELELATSDLLMEGCLLAHFDDCTTVAVAALESELICWIKVM